MSQDIRLYGSPEVWDQPLQAGQRNLLQAITDFWPAGIGSVLDVGCGDGKLTCRLQALAPERLVGLDSSAEAISRLPFDAVIAQAQALPFETRSFDLVMCTDALEHMPEEQEAAAWRELFRVADKVVMVAVPFREELLDATTRCIACDHAYHVNWHQRSYDLTALQRRCPPGWSIAATVLAGEPWSPMLPPETRLRRQLFNEWAGWELAICPTCGASGQEAAPLQPLPSLFAQTLAGQLYPALSSQRYCRSHSEILLVFQRAGADTCVPAPLLSKPRRQAASVLDFARQPAVADLRPFCQVAQHVAVEGGQWRVQFPLYQSAPCLEVRRLPGSRGDLHMVLEDEAGWLFDGCVLADGEQRRVHRLPRPPVAGYYGVLASCPINEPFARLQLGEAPAVLWAEAGKDRTCRYLPLAEKSGLVFVQVVEPLWFDPKTLSQEPPRDEPSPSDVVHCLQVRFEQQAASAAASHREHAVQLDRLQVQIQNLTAEREGLQASLHKVRQQAAQLLQDNQQLQNELSADQAWLETLNNALTNLLVSKK